jgi:hypothetical protein
MVRTFDEKRRSIGDGVRHAVLKGKGSDSRFLDSSLFRIQPLDQLFGKCTFLSVRACRMKDGVKPALLRSFSNNLSFNGTIRAKWQGSYGSRSRASCIM